MNDPATTAEAFAERLLGAFLGAADLLSVYVGDRLGLYAALRDRSLTAPELARHANMSERYAREWLEQQAVSGILTVDDAAKAAAERHYALPAAQAEVLTDGDSLNYVTPLARFLVAIGGRLPDLLAAYRAGSGISWEAFGEDAWQGQADLNRPLFTRQLAQEILPGIPPVHAALRAGARVADIACGAGWSSIAIAKGYPKARVDGYDVDTRAIAAAHEHAAIAGVADRVTFHAEEATAEHGTYDLVTIFEATHDFALPVDVLRAVRGMLSPGGSALVMDERVADAFTAPGDDVERLMYAWSVFLCLPNGLAERTSAATGTVMRTSTLRGYALDAGFGTVEVLDVEHPFFRFYRLLP